MAELDIIAADMDTRHPHEFERMLGSIARQGFAHADAALLRKLAERLWYGQSVPDLSQEQEEYRRDAGYLVDRLTRFNVVKVTRKQKVLAALPPFKPTSAFQSQGYRDTLASAWGASAELTPRLAELLPYQTREYAEGRKQSSTRRGSKTTQAPSNHGVK